MKNRKEIISGCRKGEQKAQRLLYDHFKTRLMGMCRRYTSTREEAQDALQEVFIKIFSKINNLDSDEKLESWLLRIAVTTAINHYHRNKKIVYSAIDDGFESEDHELIVSSVSDDFLIRLINELPDGCRIVFNLHVVEGYSHVEIADTLGISETTSRSQLHYAKSILKKRLNAIGVNRYEKYA